MIASPSREPRLREGSGDVSEIDRETERGRGREGEANGERDR